MAVYFTFIEEWLKRTSAKSFQLTIDSYVSVRSSRYEARGKFGEHERCIRVSQGVAPSQSPPTEQSENIILNVLVEIDNTLRFSAY